MTHGEEEKTNKEFKFKTKIDNYEMDDVILDLGFDVNILPKKSGNKWENPSLSGH